MCRRRLVVCLMEGDGSWGNIGLSAWDRCYWSGSKSWAFWVRWAMGRQWALRGKGMSCYPFRYRI